jgi:hypothetical protein
VAKTTSTGPRVTRRYSKRLNDDQLARIFTLIQIGLAAGIGAIVLELKREHSALQ